LAFLTSQASRHRVVRRQNSLLPESNSQDETQPGLRPEPKNSVDHETHEKHEREEPLMNANPGVVCAQTEPALINSPGIFFVSFVILTVYFFAGREEIDAPRRACLGGGMILH
jgi:hypothetical protein